MADRRLRFVTEGNLTPSGSFRNWGRNNYLQWSASIQVKSLLISEDGKADVTVPFNPAKTIPVTVTLYSSNYAVLNFDISSISDITHNLLSGGFEFISGKYVPLVRYRKAVTHALGAWGYNNGWTELNISSSSFFNISGSTLTLRVDGFINNRSGNSNVVHGIYDTKNQREIPTIPWDYFQVKYTGEVGSTAAPSQVSGLVATGGSKQVFLRWSNPSNDSITRYEYRRREYTGDTGGTWGNWTAIPSSGSSTVNYTVTGLKDATKYGFQVRAVNPTGNGDASLEAQATTSDAPDPDPVDPGPINPNPVVPTRNVPSAITYFNVIPRDKSATLIWGIHTDLSVTSYQYRRRTYSGGTGGSWGNWILASSSRLTTRLEVTGLANGTQYGFQIRPISNSGNGPASFEKTATPAAGTVGLSKPVLALEVGIKNVPGLGLTPFLVSSVPGLKTGDGGADFDFISTRARYYENGVPGEWNNGYYIQPQHRIGNINDEQATFYGGPTSVISRDPPLTEITVVPYFVGSDAATAWPLRDGVYDVEVYTGTISGSRASGNLRVSARSPVTKEQVTVVVPVKPDPAQFLVAISGNNRVKLTWGFPDDNTIEHYEYRQRIYPTAVWGSWTKIEGSDALTITHEITELTNNVRYGFQVRPVNLLGGADDSNEATATPMPPPVPDLVEGLEVGLEEGKGYLSWRNPNNPTILRWEYRIRTWSYPATDPLSGHISDTGFLAVPSSDSDTTEYTVSGLVDGRRWYSFQVRPRNETGAPTQNRWVPDPPKTPIPPSAPSKPTGLKVFSGDAEARITWNDPRVNPSSMSAITRYYVRYRVYDIFGEAGEFGTWEAIEGSGNNTVEHTLTGLENNLIHGIQIFCENAIGQSPPSDEAFASPSTIPDLHPLEYQVLVDVRGDNSFRDEDGTLVELWETRAIKEDVVAWRGRRFEGSQLDHATAGNFAVRLRNDDGELSKGGRLELVANQRVQVRMRIADSAGRTTVQSAPTLEQLRQVNNGYDDIDIRLHARVTGYRTALVFWDDVIGVTEWEYSLKHQDSWWGQWIYTPDRPLTVHGKGNLGIRIRSIDRTIQDSIEVYMGR